MFDVGGACDAMGVAGGLSITARTWFDYRTVVATRTVSERMNINEVTELSVCPARAGVVLVNIGRRHLVVYSAAEDTAVAADIAALRRWYKRSVI